MCVTICCSGRECRALLSNCCGLLWPVCLRHSASKAVSAQALITGSCGTNVIAPHTTASAHVCRSLGARQTHMCVCVPVCVCVCAPQHTLMHAAFCAALLISLCAHVLSALFHHQMSWEARAWSRWWLQQTQERHLGCTGWTTGTSRASSHRTGRTRAKSCMLAGQSSTFNSECVCVCGSAVICIRMCISSVNSYACCGVPASVLQQVHCVHHGPCLQPTLVIH